MCHFQGVCSRKLIYSDKTGVVAGNMRDHGVALAAHVHACYVAQPQERRSAGVACTDYDVAEFFGACQAAAGSKCELEWIVAGCGRCACRYGHVLACDGIHYVGSGDVADAHQVGIEPYAHAVVAGAESVDSSYSVDARKFVDDIEFGIVGQVQRVVDFGPVGFEGYEKYDVGRA